MKKLPIAIQLYSLRDCMPRDVPGTLRSLAEMGYEGVEFAGYYDLPAADLRAMLDDCGLRCAGSHVGIPALEGDALKQTVEFNRVLGTDRLIVPGADLDALETTIERLNAVHESVKPLGMRAGYHNHTKEFETVDGETKFNRIFSQTPDDFLVQLDIGWAACAGQDVSSLLRKYANRIETVHVKECKQGDPAAVVGEGDVDWPPIFDIIETETAGAWYIVEQEQYEVGPMESARGCIDNIRRMGR